MPVIPSPTTPEVLLAEYERLTAEMQDAVRAFGADASNPKWTFAETLAGLARLQDMQMARMAVFERLPFRLKVQVLEGER